MDAARNQLTTWAARSPRQILWAKVALVVVITCAAYAPALRGGFLWDDDSLVVKNELIKASDGIYRLWFTNQAIDYWPMTNSTFWIEWRLWGKTPCGYHVTNLLLHLAAVMLMWRMLLKLGIPGSYLASLLFAVHPVNVESVAWIAQRKNTLAMVFFLLSILWYLKSDKGRETSPGAPGEGRDRTARLWYGLSLLAFLLAMLSKGSVAVLPVVLLLGDWWRGRRIDVRALVRLAPFFVVAVALTGVNLWFRNHGQEFVGRDADFAQRLAGAGAVIWFYLSKAWLPIRLLFIYPQWHVDAGRLLWWVPLCAGLIASMVLGWQACRAKSNRGRGLLFGWTYFCVALAPVLGMTDVGFMRYSLVADHYQHIALIGVAALAAAAWCAWRERADANRRAVMNAVAGALVAVLAVLSFQQCRLYADAITLYSATLESNPESWIAHYNLGVELNEAGNVQEALAHYQAALQLKPDYVEVLNNMGSSLGSLGRMDEAIACFKRSLQIRPGRATTHYNLGKALAQMDRLEEAIEHYQQAVQLKGEYAEAWAGLAAAYGDLNRWQEAGAAANKALELARAQELAGLARNIEAWKSSHQAELGRPAEPAAPTGEVRHD